MRSNTTVAADVLSFCKQCCFVEKLLLLVAVPLLLLLLLTDQGVPGYTSKLLLVRRLMVQYLLFLSAADRVVTINTAWAPIHGVTHPIDMPHQHNLGILSAATG